MRTNYHTHTYMCGHAKGDVYDYVLEAYNKGFDVIGLSDHGPMPKFEGRMSMEVYKSYIEKLEIEKTRYKDTKMIILKGLEMEYFEDLHDFYDKLLPDLDYMGFAPHYYSDDKDYLDKSSYTVNTKEKLKIYTDYVIRAIRSGYFSFVCHPDMFMLGYPDWDEAAEEACKKICEVAIECDVPLEFNVQGIRRGFRESKFGKRYSYPFLEFWLTVQKMNAKVLIGSDCHNPKLLYDTWVEEAEAMTKKIGLNVVHEFKMIRDKGLLKK